MATGSYLTPIYSRSQSEVQGDLHNVNDSQVGKCLAIFIARTLLELLPSDDVISRVFLKSSAMKQVVAIHAGLVSTHAKPAEVYSQKVMSGSSTGALAVLPPRTKTKNTAPSKAKKYNSKS
ncbi:hypothetical protein TNCV_2417021 [Trichonephila clavipes]|nr:hypothetical protein TNCV_2417021 [Trichonephila clavipes]